MTSEEKKESDGNVRVLSREENYIYNGITIDSDDVDEHKTYRTADYMNNFRIGSFTISSNSIITKILLGFIVTAVILFLLFIALPIALVILGILLTIWVLLSFFQKR